MVVVSPRQIGEFGEWDEERFFDVFETGSEVDIDKSWEAAFPLVGSIAGTGSVMLDDEAAPVGPEIGFSPPILILPERVRVIAEALGAADAATVEDHWARLDSPFMDNGRYVDEEGKEYAMWGFRETAKLLGRAAAASSGVLFAIF